MVDWGEWVTDAVMNGAALMYGVGPAVNLAHQWQDYQSAQAQAQADAQAQGQALLQQNADNRMKDARDGLDGKINGQSYEGGERYASSTGGAFDTSDAPTAASPNDAPKVLGFEDYPGFDPAKQGSGAAYYTSDMPYTEWQDMKPKEVLDAKQQLWQAGYYGKAMPSMTAVVTAADRQAITRAMADANTTPGAGSWRVVVGMQADANGDSALDAAKAQRREQRAARAGAIADLRTFAHDNGIRLPEDFIARKANQVAAGVRGGDEVLNQLREKFVARAYPAFADDILAGENIRDIASPYISSYASLLEVPDAEVDLNDPLLKSALQNVDDKGNPAPVPLWKFERQIKKDPRWASTDNAWDEIGSQAFEVMKMFGLQS